MEYSGYDPSSPTTGQPQYKLLAPLARHGLDRREHPRHRVLGWRVQLLREPPVARRLRRDRDRRRAALVDRAGRHGRHLVRRHQPAVRRRGPSRRTSPAITPLSVIDDTWRGTLYPGGIYNDGFAKGWAQERLDQNKWPNPNAPGWVKARIAGGDTTVRGQHAAPGPERRPAQEQTDKHPYFSALDPQFRYDFPNGGDSLAPEAFVKDIKAPVFIAGAWQDEQTGGRWADLLNRFAPDDQVRAVGQNGVHTESLDPSVLAEMIEFLDFYVAQKVPTIPTSVRARRARDLGVDHRRPGAHDPAGPVRPVDGLRRPRCASSSPTRRCGSTGRSARPRARSRARRSRRPRPATTAWPIPDVRATSWYLLPDGGLGTQVARGPRLVPPRPVPGRPRRRPRTSYTGSGGGIWHANPTYDWKPVVDGKSLSYLSSPLPQTVSMAGTGAWTSGSGRTGPTRTSR